MEFIDPKYKQKHQKRLFFDYFILGIVVCLATYLLVATSLGYNLFQFNGQLLQNGFVYVDSNPVSAQIFVNNKLEDSQTETRLTLVEGDYEVTLKADGYNDWTKRFLLEGGSVKFLVYPKLFPKKLITTDVKSFATSSVGLISQSPDRRWLVVQPESTKGNLQILDLKSKENTSKTLNIPKELLASKSDVTGSLSLVEWSSDNRHLIIKEVSSDGKVNFLYIDSENISNSINLNLHFNTNPSRVALKDKKGDKFYFYFIDGGQIKVADFKSKVISETIIDQVLDFSVEVDDQLLFATTKGASSGKVMTGLWRNEKSHNIAEVIFDPESKYYFKAGKYGSNRYYLIGGKSSETAQVFANIESQEDSDKTKSNIPVTTLRPGGLIKNFGFSSQNRFIFAQSGENFAIYDFEDLLPYKYTINRPVDQDYTVSWMDDFRIMYRSNKKLNIMEFDSKNNQELLNVSDSTPIVFDRDYLQLYGFNQSDKLLILQSTALTAEIQKP